MRLILPMSVVCVCLMVTRASCDKTDEPIEVLFGREDLSWPNKPYKIRSGPGPPWGKAQFFQGNLLILCEI